MEEDVFLCPLDVGVAGAGGVVFEVNGIAVLFEEFLFFPRRGRCWRRGRNWLCHFVAFFEVGGL